jgi:phenylalanyl-tRNA synthetase beta chain
MNNSQSRLAYYEGLATYPSARCVRLLNAISADLNCMRQTLLFGGLESIEHNEKRKNSHLHFFEFGNCYDYDETKKKAGDNLAAYTEDYRLALWICGNRVDNNWAHPNEASSVYELKAHVENVLQRLGIDRRSLSLSPLSNDLYSTALSLTSPSGRLLGTFGVVDRKLRKALDVDAEVYYAELSWTLLMKEIKKNKVRFSEISRFQAVKRDLALLLDKHVSFAEVEKIANQSERKLLKEVKLFDVYEGRNLPEGKKSYAVSFTLLDEGQTLTDKQVDKIMERLVKAYARQFNAEIR